MPLHRFACCLAFVAALSFSPSGSAPGGPDGAAPRPADCRAAAEREAWTRRGGQPDSPAEALAFAVSERRALQRCLEKGVR